MMSVPELFATAHGVACTGPHRCFFCGAACEERHPAAFFVKDSFTGRTEVAAPGSPWVCDGCVLCLRESATCPMIDGTERLVTKCAMRAWSWLVTPKRVAAGSKANLERWRELCLHPPEPPFAIILSESGQKHLLYRGLVCWSQESVCVTLETERVYYRTVELSERLFLCGHLVAATGKPALDEEIAPRFAMSVIARYPDTGEALIEAWSVLRETPLSRLAGFLSPNKEICESLYPSTAIATAIANADLPGVPAKTTGPGGPGPQSRRKRKTGNQASGDPSLFDSGKIVLGSTGPQNAMGPYRDGF